MDGTNLEISSFAEGYINSQMAWLRQICRNTVG